MNSNLQECSWYVVLSAVNFHLSFHFELQIDTLLQLNKRKSQKILTCGFRFIRLALNYWMIEFCVLVMFSYNSQTICFRFFDNTVICIDSHSLVLNHKFTVEVGFQDPRFFVFSLYVINSATSTCLFHTKIFLPISFHPLTSNLIINIKLLRSLDVYECWLYCLGFAMFQLHCVCNRSCQVPPCIMVHNFVILSLNL